MYAHSFALSKKFNYDLYIDNISGYQKSKNLLRNHQVYMLNNFNLIGTENFNDLLVNNYFSFIFRKFFLTLDKLKTKKTFHLELKNKTKIINETTPFKPSELVNKIYVAGNFENQIYFKDYRNDLIKIFKPKKEKIDLENPLISQLQNSNSVSIHIRRDRFSDQKGLSNKLLALKSKSFTDESIIYINKAINYFNNKINNPKYFIWSNNHTNIDDFTKNLIISDFKLVESVDVINDFYLFNFSKHFIVSPSSFHWWGAWLNTNNNKICLFPANLNPSNNLNFWPKEWVSM